MCGISGVFLTRESRLLPNLLGKMSQRLTHRGPDDHGMVFWRQGQPITEVSDGSDLYSLGFAHRRLAIVERQNSRQPLVTEDKKSVLIFNGEIYNHDSLRTDLIAQGSQFQSRSDTEVLCRILTTQGLRGLGKVVGMFAFAFFDSCDQSVVLCRDPSGIKPLYFHASHDKLIFGSEIQSVLEGMQKRAEVNRACAFQYLLSGTSDATSETMFDGVQAVLPGQFLKFFLADGAIRSIRGQVPVCVVEAECAVSGADVAREFRESVLLHSETDLPFAVSLSGGVDSSMILGVIADTDRRNQCEAFHYRQPSDEGDHEFQIARMSAEFARIPLNVVEISNFGIAERVDRVISLQEIPFGSTSVIAQHEVDASIADRGFRIVLDGQGADELFGGYEYFRIPALADLIATGDVVAVGHFLRSVPSIDRLKVLARSLLYLNDRSRRNLRRLRDRRIAASLLGVAREIVWSEEENLNQHHVGASRLRKEVDFSRNKSSLPMLLRYADRNAMSVSIENRTPFLTPGITSVSSRLSDRQLVDNEGMCKKILRDSAMHLVHPAVLEKRKKVGFETSESSWVKAFPEFGEWILATVALSRMDLFQPERRARLTAIGRGEVGLTPLDWRMLNFSRWLQLFDLEF